MSLWSRCHHRPLLATHCKRPTDHQVLYRGQLKRQISNPACVSMERIILPSSPDLLGRHKLAFTCLWSPPGIPAKQEQRSGLIKHVIKNDCEIPILFLILVKFYILLISFGIRLPYIIFHLEGSKWVGEAMILLVYRCPLPGVQVIEAQSVVSHYITHRLQYRICRSMREIFHVGGIVSHPWGRWGRHRLWSHTWPDLSFQAALYSCETFFSFDFL